MAKSVISLAVKIYADATGITEQLTPVERALKNLDAEAAKVTSVFDKFGSSSAAAAAAQEKFGVRVQALTESLRAGLVTPADFAEQLERLQQGANDAAAEMQRAAEIIAASMSDEEKAQRAFAASTDELNKLRASGLLTEEQYQKALEKAVEKYAKATTATTQYADAAKTAADSTKEAGIKFNEITGALGLLPGPFGAVAAKISSLSSTAEGLGKIRDKPQEALASIGKTIASLQTPIGLATAALGGLTAAVGALTSLESRVQRLGNTADKLGVSFQFVQTLEDAAKRSGIGIEAVSAAFGRLQKTLVSADEDGKKANATLAKIGVTSEQLQKLSPEEQYRLIGERLQQITNPAERTAAAIALFGKSGASLLPFFKNIGPAAEDMERLGRALTDLDRRRIEEFGNGLNALKTATQGLSQTLILPFAGIGEGITRALSEVVGGVTRIVDPIGKVLEPVLSTIGRSVEVIGILLGGVGRAVGNILEPFGKLAEAVSVAIKPLNDGIVNTVRYLSDGYVSLQKWVISFSAFGAITATIQKLGEYISRVVTIISTGFVTGFEYVTKLLSGAGGAISDVVNKFLDFTGLGDTVRSVLGAIGTAFGTLWDTIKGIVSGIGGFIERVLQFAEDWLGIKTDVEKPVEASVEFSDGGAIQELLAENKEFQKTLDGITGSVANAVNESTKFGEAGFNAALKYQNAVAELKDKLDRGLFNEETFRREAEKAGEAFKQELAKIEEDAKLEIQIKEEAQKTLAGLQEQINKVVEDANKFGDAGFDAAAKFQDKVRELGQAFEDGRLNSEGLRQEVEKATAEYNKQIESLKRIEDVKKRFSPEVQKEVEVEKDLVAIREEQARLEQEIADRRATTPDMAEYSVDSAFADEAQARLDELKSLEEKVLEQQTAIEGGFGDNFAAIFGQTANQLDSIIEKASQFGNAGAEAYEEFKNGIERLQEQARAGIINRETYEAEVARQRTIIDEELKGFEEKRRREEEARKQAFQAQIEANNRVNEFLSKAIDERTGKEIAAQEEINKRKREAAENIAAIENRINTEKKAREAALAQGDLAAARGSTQRINALQAVQRQEQKIWDGRARAQQAANVGQQRNAEEALASVRMFQGLADSQVKMVSDASRQLFGTYQAIVQAQTDEAVARAEEIRKSLILGPQQIEVADVRTREGQQMLLDFSTPPSDPMLAEARISNRLLNRIQQGLVANLSRIGVPASL